MLNFFKKRSYEIVKILIDQIAIALFGISLAFATSDIPALSIVTSIFSILFFLFLIYIMMWDIGYKDSGAIERGNEKISRLTGLYMALVANIPNFILAIFITLGNFLPNIPFFSSAGGICATIALLFEGMYMGLLRAIEINNTPLFSYWFVWFIVTIPLIATATIAYYAGSKCWRLFPTAPKKN